MLHTYHPSFCSLLLNNGVSSSHIKTIKYITKTCPRINRQFVIPASILVPCRTDRYTRHHHFIKIHRNITPPSSIKPYIVKFKIDPVATSTKSECAPILARHHCKDHDLQGLSNGRQASGPIFRKDTWRVNPISCKVNKNY